MSTTPYRIGVDTGGTFTDVVLVDAASRVVATHKLLSTPDDPARAVLDGIGQILNKAGLRSVEPPVVHGSTVATNALLEGTTERAAFITTAGFEDTLAIARQNRPDLYALVPRRPDPPVGREACIGVSERVGADGAVLAQLKADTTDALVERVRAMDVAAVAISLLHSYVNPAHEQMVADALRAALGERLHLTVSSQLLPEYREYERGATCIINAVVAPRMVRYLGRLTREVGDERLRIMASHGGTLPVDVVLREPVRTILSGPAGGVLGAAAMARAAGVDRAITFDMGGTSTDVALIEGEPTLSTEGEAAGLPVRLPMVDIHTVGAGGGSIAWIDPGGALRVGPQSAGADPGPACYGRQAGNALKATVTDAHVVLGHIPADAELGEGMRIDAARAAAALEPIAKRIGKEVHEAAEGLLRVVEATMARAVQRISLQRGHDPRVFTLLPFGGAGGLHACRLAESLRMSRVLVPRYPGLLSAVGMVGAAPRHAFSHAVLAPLQPDVTGAYPNPLTLPPVVAAIASLRQRADDAMARDTSAGAGRRDAIALDLRYVGQSYEITVSADAGDDPVGSFLETHRRLYGYVAAGKAIDVVAARWMASGTQQPVQLAASSPASIPPREIPVYRDGRRERWRLLARESLAAGATLEPRAIIVEYSATTVIPPGWRGQVDAVGQLLLERDGDAA